MSKEGNLKAVIKSIDQRARRCEAEGLGKTLDYDYYAASILEALDVFITTKTTEIVVMREDFE